MSEERKLTLEVQDLIDRFNIERGGHDFEYVRARSKDPKDLLDYGNNVCIMEMVGVLQGVGVNTRVPCVSGVITTFMVRLNDRMLAGTQKVLVDVIPYILHTAPIHNKSVNNEYRRAETKRGQILKAADGFFTEYRMSPQGETWDEIIALIKEAADVRRWEKVIA